MVWPGTSNTLTISALGGDSLSESEQDKVAVAVQALEEFGPNLSFPLSSGIRGSKHPHMRELRIQQGGRPLRVLYAFIQNVPQFCCWVVIRPVTTVGTT